MPRPSAPLFTLAIMVLVGCGGGVDRLPTATVSGTITLDGEPLKKGRVTFVPQDGSGRPATGITQSDGSFVLGTYDDDDGAILGWHRVAVVCQEPRGLPPNDGGTRSLIPLAYTNPGTSGLDFEVTAERDNVFKIALTTTE